MPGDQSFPYLEGDGRVQLENSSGNLINPATSEGQEMTTLLKSILGAIQYSRNADMTNNSDRVTVVNTVATTVSSITTLTNLQQMNGVQSELIPRMMEYSAWNLNVRSTIS